MQSRRNELVSHVFNIRFNTSYIPFRLDFIPSFVFIDCYIQPDNSKSFDASMFSDLCSLLLTAKEKKLGR